MPIVMQISEKYSSEFILIFIDQIFGITKNFPYQKRIVLLKIVLDFVILRHTHT